ncbi:hypothetical protein [Rubeoparvulum massiliense]|uniref:hypothetical protein n=1 Tax=Rubeoparvulum massiliense TaxID=1631346 RepID=UPI00065DDE8B|nr:hypothetical protein [Rubeoparvulum massiliense]
MKRMGHYLFFILGIIALYFAIPMLHIEDEERLSTPFALLWIALAVITLFSYLYSGLLQGRFTQEAKEVLQSRGNEKRALGK